MGNFLQDLRYGLRVLLKQRGFTVIAVIALALGIGANTAIFSVVNAVLLRPLPYQAPEQLVWIWETNPLNEIKEEPASLPNFMDWRQQNQSFSDLTAYGNASVILTSGGEPERLPGAAVVANFFSVLGVEPISGRAFRPEENEPGKHQVVILSHGLWQRRFGADPNLLNQPITINGNPYTVVGIMPPGFQHPSANPRNPIEVWSPLPINLDQAGRRSDFLGVIARLKPAASLEQARAEMLTIARQLEQQYPATNNGWSVTLLPLHERFVGDLRPALLVLLGAVGFLLLIACANVANLLLARATTRQKELAIRTALGAKRWRIVQQLLTESLILSLLGGGLGLLLAVWGMDLLIALSPDNIPRLNELSLDLSVLTFTLLVSVVTGLIFGLLPALNASRLNLNETLKESGRSAAEGVRGTRLRNLLAVSEIALSLVLLIGAGLMLRSFVRLQEVNPGFNSDNLLSVSLSLPSAKYGESSQVARFYEQLLNRLQAQPGVQAVAATTSLPLAGGGSYLAFSIEGQVQAPTDRVPDAEVRTVTLDYFRTLQIPLQRGRLFTERDNQTAPRAMVISESLAKRYFPNEDPLDKRLTFGNPTAPDTVWYTIVGIVGDTHHTGLDEAPYEQAYRSYLQVPARSMTVVLRTATDPKAMISALRSEVWGLDKEQPLYNIRTMDEFLADAVARPRFNVWLITIFAVVALLLASVGIYGVISYTVTQRTHEIGIRLALGAQPRMVFKLVVGQAMLLAVIGLGIGLVAAFGLTRWLESLLFNVSATDPITFAVIPLLLGLVAFLASYLPARRAMRVDPMIALRYE